MLAAALRSSSSRVLRRPVISHCSRLSTNQPAVQVFHFSSENDSKKKEGGEDSLRDTVNRLKEESNTDGTSTKKDEQVDDLLRKAADLWETAKSEISLTWQELVNAGRPKSINKKIHPKETEEGNKEYTGPVEIMVIDESEHLTAWERMQRRLTEAPIIQGMVFG